jgi:putative inorganic carbon (HCO3(-)) transporter
MRSLLLMTVVVCVAIVGLFRPRVGLFGYIWFALMRPDLMAYARGDYSTLLALSVITGSIRYLPNAGRAWIRNPLSVMLILLTGVAYLSACDAIYPSYSVAWYWPFFRMVIMALFVPLLITDIKAMKYLCLVTALSLGFWGLRHGVTGVIHGGLRIDEGIGGGFMGENNTFAAGMAMIVPFCWLGRTVVHTLSLKLLLLLTTGASIAAVVLTHSRGGALALLAVLAMLVLQSRRRLQGLATICGAPQS